MCVPGIIYGDAELIQSIYHKGVERLSNVVALPGSQPIPARCGRGGAGGL